MTEAPIDGPDEQEPTAPTGYRLILPPGWVRIPLREGTAEALDELIFSRLKELPPDIPKDKGMKYRLMIRRSVEQQIAAARKANGLDLYLPVQQRYRSLLSASFLVSEVVFIDGPDPEIVLSAITASGGEVVTTRTIELADTLAARREYVRPPAPERDIVIPMRHVEYALPVPYAPSRFLAVSFSTAGNGDPNSEFTQAVVEIFDALMTTFRWTDGNLPQTSTTGS